MKGRQIILDHLDGREAAHREEVALEAGGAIEATTGEARAQGRFDAATLDGVESFLNDPRAWQAARG